MSVIELVEQARILTIEERKHLISLLVDTLTEAQTPSRGQRIFDLHPNAMIMSEDFDAELPDEFWLGE